MRRTEQQIIEELERRRVEYYKKKKRRTSFAAGIAGTALVAIVCVLALLPGIKNGRGGASSALGPDTTETAYPGYTKPPQQGTEKMDVLAPWIGAPCVRGGWYEGELDIEQRKPDSVTVYLYDSEASVIYDVKNIKGIKNIIKNIELLEKTPVYGYSDEFLDVEFSVHLYYGDTVFRCTKFKNGYYKINERGAFTMPQLNSDKFSRLAFSGAFNASSVCYVSTNGGENGIIKSADRGIGG